MADQPETDTPELPIETTEPEEQGDPELADPGKKAIAAERRARAAAEREAKALKTRLDEIEAAQLSKEEAAEKRAAEAEQRAVKSEAAEMRWKVARTVPDITDEEVELFLTGADEDTLNRQADALRQRSVPQPGKGTHVPGVGNQPAKPPTITEQIRVAEASGDKQAAMALKTQQLMDLRSK